MPSKICIPDYPTDPCDGSAPAGTCFWESPGIWMNELGLDPNIVGSTYALYYNTEYAVNVTVHNKDTAAAANNVRVKIAWVPLGTGWSSGNAHWLPLDSSNPGNIVAGPQTINANGQRDFGFYLNTGTLFANPQPGQSVHGCLFAQAWGDGDEAPDAGNPEAMFNVFPERHRAQHNTDVIASPPPGPSAAPTPHSAPAGAAAFGFQIAHADPQAIDSRLRIVPIDRKDPLLARVAADLGRRLNGTFTVNKNVRFDTFGLMLGQQKIRFAGGPKNVGGLGAKKKVPQLDHMGLCPELLHPLHPVKRTIAFQQASQELRQGYLWIPPQPTLKEGELYGIRVMHTDGDNVLRGGFTLVIYQAPR